jgi:hypothetical protein
MITIVPCALRIRAHGVVGVLGLTLALAAGGCASGRLASLPPTGVNLSGEWVLNPSLSDDPESFQAQQKKSSSRRRKSSSSSAASGEAEPTALQEDSGREGVSLDAMQRMSIQQEGAELRIQVQPRSGEPPTPRKYTAGALTACADGARCEAGWRGQVLIVDTMPKKGKAHEETYALDEDGHLIVTIQGSKTDVKLAYDRMHGS